MSGAADHETGEPEFPYITGVPMREILRKAKPGSVLEKSLARCTADLDHPTETLRAFGSFASDE